jgi:hypothetical protein
MHIVLMRAVTTLSPEAELILCCARTQPNAQTTERIRVLLERELDWPTLVGTALVQRVAPLLYTWLSTIRPEAVPTGVLADLEARFLANAERDLLLVAELPRVMTAFESRGVRAIPFKGPLIAAALYQNLALRRFYDLDILVHPYDVLGAKDALRSLGYRQEGFAGAWEWHFMEERGRWPVDLHERVTPRYFPSPASFDELWEKLEPVSLQDIPILTLAPAHLLLVLSLQLAKDCRQCKQRLAQICDAAELVRTYPDLDWEFILQRARAIGILRIVLLELQLVNHLLDAPLPEGVLQAVRADRRVRSLADRVNARLFPRPGAPVQAVRAEPGIHRVDSGFYLSSRERLRDKAGYVFERAGVRLLPLITPTDRDRRFVALPRALAFLYYLVRPVRVLVQWARTGQLRSHDG